MFQFDMGNDSVTCSSDPLNTAELFRDIKPYGIAVFTLESILLVTSWIVCAETFYSVSKRLHEDTVKKRCLFIVLTYPIFILISYISVIVPKTAPASMTAGSLYLAIVLYQFQYLLRDYFEGRQNFLKVMSTTEISLASFPICMCRCLPMITMTQANVDRVRYCVLQHAVLRPLLYYVMLLVSMATDTYPSRYDKNMPYFYITLVINLSTILAMYGIGLARQAMENHLHECKIGQKFTCLRLILITTIMQETVLSLLTSFDVIPCLDSGPLANEARSLWINNNLLIFEMFLLLLWARVLYRAPRGSSQYGYTPVEDDTVTARSYTDEVIGEKPSLLYPQVVHTKSSPPLDSYMNE
ncbi:organic solute transporter subunit alpha-like [Ptychodera flava]|uniref:organic solute transporter subunit alpha-like n=1 Tax=Ptychodera flava TaxID=63121 RepID=UPI003969F455